MGKEHPNPFAKMLKSLQFAFVVVPAQFTRHASPIDCCLNSMLQRIYLSLST